jgi:hypothetical protein
MKPHALSSLLPLAALALAVTACQPADDDEAKDDSTSSAPALVAEGATLAWSTQLESDWSPTHAVAVGDLVIVSSSWEIDEGAEVTAYTADGGVAWQQSTYDAALLAPVGDDQVLVCESDVTTIISVDDGSVVSEGPGEDEDDRCPVADDEEGIPVPHNDEAYTVNGAVLTVDAPGGSYDVTLDQPVDEIWGVDGGVVAFVDESDTVMLYR